MDTLDFVEREQMRMDVPHLRPGDKVRVHYRIREGDKVRVQVYEGVLIGRALDVRGDAPVVHERGVGQTTVEVGMVRIEVVETDHGLGVADVEGEEHGA